MQDADLMAEELRIAKTEGISCIVDGGHPDMGRDINFLRRISMMSGMPKRSRIFSQTSGRKPLPNMQRTL